ncbi:RING finger protein 215 [Corvus kubaryi]|uniref:RING finger protein 215 n=1 Tax=Corvus kubaryi TaxID=68294 RepID=UPI001C04A89F|nr:RING finger protein 215 [Corvus kubaryi]
MVRCGRLCPAPAAVKAPSTSPGPPPAPPGPARPGPPPTPVALDPARPVSARRLPGIRDAGGDGGLGDMGAQRGLGTIGDGAGSAGAAPGGSYTLRGAVLGAGGGRTGPGRGPRGEREEMEIQGRLVLVGDVEPELGAADSWIGVVPVGTEEPAEGPRGAKEESFTTAVVTKMKRALVLGASALLILALNQNAIRELDVSQLLAKPVIIIQSSDNVTRLLGALLRGLRATAKITYQAVLLENLGVTLTLWSTCGLSRGGLYGEWQGVICPGESSSQVQKYLQQLWNTILLIALLLCTGVMVQAQRQSRQDLSERDAELDLKQHIRQRLSALKMRRYHPGKPPRSRACEIDSCAVCLDQFHKSQWLRVLPCSHEFHRDCVDPWLLLQQTCPLCKRNILGNCCTDS